MRTSLTPCPEAGILPKCSGKGRQKEDIQQEESQEAFFLLLFLDKHFRFKVVNHKSSQISCFLFLYVKKHDFFAFLLTNPYFCSTH